MSAVEVDGQVYPEIGVELSADADDNFWLSYDTLLARADTIRTLICDGTLDPVEGIWLILFPPDGVREAERARRSAEHARLRFTPEARQRALDLVAGGASFRVAAASALGDARHRMQVWRWARERRRVTA